ncbi:hypothetical protein B0H17DRAFT_1111685 [Mycena rosella]|uniref:Secreted protein n=1 Tax=Mycena rosella TaxID=1033263 RepID=A0AAD7BL65_MYCRO|nr:hypothetical protein B0H17DRAFT_1111685 [Mycena rosella]
MFSMSSAHISLFLFTFCTPVINARVVFEIAATKGVPNASFSSFKSGTAGANQAEILSRRISVMVG